MTALWKPVRCLSQRAELVDEQTGTGMIQRLAEYVDRRKERVFDGGEQKSA